MIDIIEKMKTEMLRRKYSIRTITSYCDVVSKFLKQLKKEDLRRINKGDIREYLNKMHKKAGNTINVHLQALKFMMEEILHKNGYVHIKFSKTPKRVAECLTKEEVMHLFDAIDNPKHKFLIRFLYSTGMRVSELVNLKIGNIEVDKRQGLIIGGKGNKDRIFIIAEKIVDELQELVGERQSHEFIFSGRHGHLSQRSVQEILRQAAKKAGFNKQIHPHTMRHSFATHYIENGGNEFTLQALLGHSDRRSTEVYTHTVQPRLTGVKSPLDHL